jgi:phage terminase small subunit
LEGNRGRRALPKGEPEPSHLSAIDARPPDHLDRVGKNLWKRVLRAMPEGVITKADREVLELYCDAYAQYRQAKGLLKEVALARVRAGVKGLTKAGTVEETPNGAYQTSPLVTQMRQWSAMTVKLAGELGLTPPARVRLAIGRDDAESNDEAWLSQGAAARVVDVHK